MYINSTLCAENEYNDAAGVESAQYLSLQRDYRLPETQGPKVRSHLSLIIMNTIPAISFDLVIWKRVEKIFHSDCKVIGRNRRELRCSLKKTFLKICSFIIKGL